VLRGCDETPEIVADYAFENHFNAQQVDLLGELERIRVHPEGRQ
jgi:hypothetical protein